MTYGAYGLGGLVGLVILFIVSKKFMNRKKQQKGQNKQYSGTKPQTKKEKDYKYTPINTKNVLEQKLVNRTDDTDFSDDQEEVKPIEKSKMMEEHHKVDESEEESNVANEPSYLVSKNNQIL